MPTRPEVTTGKTEHILLSAIDGSIRGGFTLLAKLFALSINERLSNTKNEEIAKHIEAYAYGDFSYGKDSKEVESVLINLKNKKQE